MGMFFLISYILVAFPPFSGFGRAFISTRTALSMCPSKISAQTVAASPSVTVSDMSVKPTVISVHSYDTTIDHFRKSSVNLRSLSSMVICTLVIDPKLKFVLTMVTEKNSSPSTRSSWARVTGSHTSVAPAVNVSCKSTKEAKSATAIKEELGGTSVN